MNVRHSSYNGDFGWSPGIAFTGVAFGEAAEEGLANRLQVCGQSVVDFVGVIAEAVLESSDPRVMDQVERFSRPVLALPLQPGAQHSVLQDGQLIHAVAEIVQ